MYHNFEIVENGAAIVNTFLILLGIVEPKILSCLVPGLYILYTHCFNYISVFSSYQFLYGLIWG